MKITTYIIAALSLAMAGCCDNQCKPQKAAAAAPNPMFSTATINYKIGASKWKSDTLKAALQADGAYRVSISKDKLNAIKDLTSVDILMPACYAKKGEDGYFINTLSMLGTYKLDNNTYSSNVRNHMPFFGMKNPRATWVAIVKGLNLEFSMCAFAANGEYKVFPRFEIDKMEGMPVYEDIVVDFYPLPANATYVDMAKVYRKYQVGRGEVKPLKERIKTNPKLERMAKSIMCRITFGSKPIPKDPKTGKRIIKDYTLQTELPMRVYCTFDQATQAIKDLKAAGCDNVDLQFVGWNIRGHDGRYPQLLPVEPACGGEEKMKEAVETAKKLGYYISVHVNHTDAYRIADCWDESYIAKRKDGSLMYVGCWAGGKAYTPCPQAIFEPFPKKDYLMIRDRLGLNGMQHVDVISAIAPRICHDPNHKLNRKEWTQAYLKIMKYGHEVSGGFTSECGFDHVIKYLDWSFYVNHSTHLPKMFDRHVPIWQLVYHGFVPTEAFYSDTGNNLLSNWSEVRLHHAEFGGRPVYYGGWTTKERIDKFVKPLYDEYQKVAYLQLELMEDHKKLADNVYLTVYGNGDEVVTNYSEFTFEYKGKPVFAKDYRLYKKQ